VRRGENEELFSWQPQRGKENLFSNRMGKKGARGGLVILELNPEGGAKKLCIVEAWEEKKRMKGGGGRGQPSMLAPREGEEKRSSLGPQGGGAKVVIRVLEEKKRHLEGKGSKPGPLLKGGERPQS